METSKPKPEWVINSLKNIIEGVKIKLKPKNTKINGIQKYHFRS